MRRLTQARAIDPPAFVHRSRRRPRGRRLLGVKYERRAHRHFAARYDTADAIYVPGPWFSYRREGGSWRFCQPDALVIRPRAGRICILEYKYNHCLDAWRQLRLLYAPVVAAAFGADLWAISCVEVAKWYDPAVLLPEPVRLVRDPLDAAPKDFGVHIWRPHAGD